VATFVGAVVGFALGAALGLAGYYLLFMAPQGQPFNVIDQGVLLIWLTGPLGAVAGGCPGRRLRTA
jgi:hypothetical protein